jgi:hypothetical protein
LVLFVHAKELLDEANPLGRADRRESVSAHAHPNESADSIGALSRLFRRPTDFLIYCRRPGGVISVVKSKRLELQSAQSVTFPCSAFFYTCIKSLLQLLVA